MNHLEKVIIELGPGLDDAYGLAVLIGAHRMNIINILAFVCSSGNVPKEQACKNLLQILHVLNFTSVSVYEGANSPIIRLPKYASPWGPRGMGNLPKANNCSSDIVINPLSEFGYFLEEEMKKYKDSITLIVMTPLTTVAVLMLLNSKLTFSQIWVLGGNSIGSTIPESNFHYDPEATFSVLKYSPVPITLITRDLSKSIKIPMHWRLTKLGKISTPFMRMMNDAECLDVTNKNDIDLWQMDATVLAVAYIFPEIIRHVKRYEVSVNIDESVDSSGQLILSKNSLSRDNVKMIENVNGKKFKKRLLSVLCKC